MSWSNQVDKIRLIKVKLSILLLVTCYLLLVFRFSDGFFSFTFSAGGWMVCKLKLMLTQPPTELKLELGLSLAISLLFKSWIPWS